MKNKEELTEPPTCPICDTPFYNNQCNECGYE